MEQNWQLYAGELKLQEVHVHRSIKGTYTHTNDDSFIFQKFIAPKLYIAQYWSLSLYQIPLIDIALSTRFYL